MLFKRHFFSLFFSTWALGAAPLHASAGPWVHTTTADFAVGSTDGEVQPAAVGNGGLQLAKKAGALGAFSADASYETGVQSAGFATDDSLYTIGGLLSTNYSVVRPEVMRGSLDSSGNITGWALAATHPNPASNQGLARWGSRIYVGGGYQAGGFAVSDLYSIPIDSSGALGAWRSETTLPFTGQSHLFAVKGRLYLLSVGSTTMYSAPILADGSVGSWASEGLSYPRSAANMYVSLTGERLWGFGGQVTNIVETSLIGDGASGAEGAWQARTSLPGNLRGTETSSLSSGGKFYLLGGFPSISNSVVNSSVYSADVTADGSLGSWTTETQNLPAGRSDGLQLFARGCVYYLGGYDGSTYLTTNYHASLNQGALNAAQGSYVGGFDLGSTQFVDHLEWDSNFPSYVRAQARTAPASKVFGAWIGLASGPLPLGVSARYVEYRLEFSDPGAGNTLTVTEVRLSADALTATPTASPTASGSPTFTATPTATPSTLPTPLPGSVCTSFSGSVIAFYGGNSDGQLRDQVGSFDLSPVGSVGNASGGQPEGDRWLGTYFSGTGTQAWYEIPPAAWPGTSGAIDFKMQFLSSNPNTAIMIEKGADYLTLNFTNSLYGFDLVVGGTLIAAPYFDPAFNTGQTYDIRLEWDPSGIRAKVDGVLISSTGIALNWSSVDKVIVGAYPGWALRDLQSKIDGLAVLGDPAGTVCQAYGSATPTRTTSPSPSASPCPTVTATPSATAYAPQYLCQASANVSLPFSGVGTPGDILMTTYVNHDLVGFNPSTESFYLYAVNGANMTGDVMAYPSDPTQILVTQGNNTLNRYDANGVFQGAWGTTTASNLQLGSFAPDGAYWAADQVGNGIYRIPAGGGAGTTRPLSIAVSAPTACIFDNLGNLYISDSLGAGGRILKIIPADQGSPTMTATVLLSGLINIYGMAYDGDHSLYFTSSAATGKLYKADTITGVATLLDSNFAPLAENGGGPLYHGGDAILGLDGALYAAQNQNPGVAGILKFDLNGNPIKFYSYPATVGGLSTSGWYCNGLGLLGSTGIRVCAPTPTPSSTKTPSASPTFTPAALSLACPVTPDVSLPFSGSGTPGDLLITTYSGNRLVGFDPATETFYLHSTGSSAMTGDVSPDPSDPTKLVVVQGNVLYRYDANGANLGLWATTSASNLQLGAFAPDGAYWVADQSGNRLYRIPAGGGTGQGKYFSTSSNAPTGCAFDAAGNLYVTDALTAGGRILKVIPSDQSAVTMTTTVLASGILNGGGLAYDGDHGLYFTSSSAGGGSSKVYRVDSLSGAAAIITSNFAPLTENAGGPLYQGGDSVFGLDGSLWVVTNMNPGAVHGILKMDTAGDPLKFYAFPATIGGVSTAGWWANGLAVLGLASNRACAATASPSPTRSASPTSTSSGTLTASSTASATPSISPTRTPSASPSASPSRTLTASLTASFSPSPTVTPSPSPSRTASASATATVTATPSVTQTPGTGLTVFVTFTCTSTPTPVVFTPTLVNTVTAVVSATPIVCPRRPPGDGQPQKIIIWSKTGGDCAVRVYRPEGRLCRRVWDGHLMPNEIKTLFWDSADEAGQSVSSGVYIAVFKDGNGAIHKARMAILR